MYGDRGTGKSSTVKALLNEFYPKGLRVIEMPKESLMDFPKLVDQIAAIPMKFIIFIDDLSFPTRTTPTRRAQSRFAGRIGGSAG